jgi:hypothetical protein
MNKTQRGRRSQITKRMPKKTTIAMAIPKGSSLKICSIYDSAPTPHLLAIRSTKSEMYPARRSGYQEIRKRDTRISEYQENKRQGFLNLMS